MRLQSSSYILMAGAVCLMGGSILAEGVLPGLASVASVSAAAFAALGALRATNQWVEDRDRIGFRALRWIHALAFEALAVLGAACLKPFRTWSSRRVLSCAAAGTPILLVHGYLHDSTAWIYQRKKLAKAGLGPIYTMNLKNPFSSIVVHAEQVAQKTAQIEQETGRSDLILIGHSMGGLVASWYATQLASPTQVTDVITLGSPFSGTHLAKIGIGPNAREMERHSVFLQALQQAIANSATRFYHIASTVDEIIMPADSAILPTHPDKQAIFDDVGHLALLFSPRVADQIAGWLKR